MDDRGQKLALVVVLIVIVVVASIVLTASMRTSGGDDVEEVVGPPPADLDAGQAQEAEPDEAPQTNGDDAADDTN